jgi:hypothetical protein
VRGEMPVRLSLLILLAAGWTLLAAEPSQPYLLTGPTALRYAKAPDATREFKWPSLFPAPAPVAQSNLVEQVSEPAATNSAVAESTVPSPSPVPTQPDSLASTEPSPPPVAPPAWNLDNVSSSASPMLLVTPQMLADFFRSNSAAANVIPNWDLRFMPPIAMPPPSSEAVYRSD